MPHETDLELRSMAEILLQKARRDSLGALEAALAECQGEISSAALPGSQVGRGILVNAWTKALERHSYQALSGLLGLFRAHGTAASAPWLRERFRSHVDDLSSDLLARLADTRVAGAATSSAERKRLANVVAAIKAGAEPELREAEASLASRRQEGVGFGAPAAPELDDRLPLHRRGAFDRELRQGMEDARQNQEPLSLVMIDLDHFKRVNDEHGHATGDEVLLAVSLLVTRRVAAKGRAYRYGGEELAVLLPNYSEEEALGLAERLRKDVAGAPIGSRHLQITASLGVACSTGCAPDPLALLQAADAALYAAKGQGRNCVRGSGGQVGDQTE